MKITQYQVDAFSTRVFAGNPAAVCPLDSWLEDELLQAIAAENNLSETAFFVPTANSFKLRWFTPTVEVDLCGHATLATAHVLFTELGYSEPSITFATRSGDLVVTRRDDLLTMNFPAQRLQPCAVSQALCVALGQRPSEVWAGDIYMAVFDSEATIRSLTPNMERLRELDLSCVIVTAPSTTVDFVSRFFAPQVGVPEDPVTGSAHCKLTPYWAAKLGRNTLHARQVSQRGGDVYCELLGDRVLLSGHAVTFMRGEIFV